MCDQYNGNCLGHTYEYWNEFNGYYGPSKSIANWFDAVINNGNGSSNGYGYAATSWITLLTTADGLGISEFGFMRMTTQGMNQQYQVAVLRHGKITGF